MDQPIRPVGISGNEKALDQFARDVEAGLKAQSKFLPSKYLYNKKGDALFQQIMDMEEYYPTNCEYNIFENKKQELLARFADGAGKFNLIEFGAGDGKKTKVLLGYFLGQEADFRYSPIDISSNIVEMLEQDLRNNFPDLEVEGICEDYFNALNLLNQHEKWYEDHSQFFPRKVIFFLGSNIGNFSWDEAIQFLKNTAAGLRKGDQMLIGFDLKKEPEKILKAYNDKKGITKAFNLNLLERINEELGGEFNLATFEHFPIYDPQDAVAKSFLVSTREQSIKIDMLDETFHFQPWETIYMEKSQKYTKEGIEALAGIAGFEVVQHFYDENAYYVNSLWQI